MNRFIYHFAIISTLIISLSSPLHATEKYTIDPMHSYVLWHISHFDFSHPSGKWMAAGTLEIDDKNLQNSKANVTIKMADIITGIKDLDHHLQGKLFFDVQQYPTATFVSNKVDVVDNKIHKVHGALTVHGVTKPVTLNVKPNKKGVNPISEKTTVGFSADTMIKRSDFGIKTMVPEIGDNVKLEIEVEAYKP